MGMARSRIHVVLFSAPAIGGNKIDGRVKSGTFRQRTVPCTGYSVVPTEFIWRGCMTEYVELHCRSAFSFLRGASLPEDLAKGAAQLQMPALALCDRDGLYGAPQFFGHAREA